MISVDTSHTVLQFAKRFFAGTLLSRISGVARDVSMAFCFGSAPEIYYPAPGRNVEAGVKVKF